MKKTKKVVMGALTVGIIGSVLLTGAMHSHNGAEINVNSTVKQGGIFNFLDYALSNIKSKFAGRSATIQTYDENSNVIDRVHGNSIDIEADRKFKQTNEKGETIKNSSVLDITVGGKQMIHVGSSLIMYEDGLTDLFAQYNKKVDIKNQDSSTPIVNRIVNNFKNYTTGKSKIVLIRSQSGKPLATFAGNDVSYFEPGVDKSTGIQIDGKYLFIYRCDYTIYDMDLLT